MKAWVTLCKKELMEACQSPLVFLFLIGFSLVAEQLFLATAFRNNQASFNGFFIWIPILWIVFLPALTMDRWVMEFKSKTIDLLNATPISWLGITTAKFATATSLMTLALLFMLPLFLTFAKLGSFDWGVTTTSLFGTWLIGVFGISLGLFFSRFTRHTITSYLFTLLTLLMLTTIAHPLVVQNFPIGIRPWLEILSLDENFKFFLLGLVPLKSILLLGGLSLILLALQAIRHVNIFSVFKAMLLASLLIILSRQLPMSWALDATQNQQHTLSASTQTILHSLQDQLTIKVYFSKDVPFEVQKIEDALLDLLRTIKQRSSKDIFIEFSETDSATASEKAKQLGLAPLTLRVVEQNSEKTKNIFMGLSLHYQDKIAVIPTLTEPSTFEYQLALRLLKLQTKTFPKIGVLLPEGVLRAEFSAVLGLFEQLSDVLLIEKNQTDWAGLNLNALVVIDPKDLPTHFSQNLDTLLSQNVPVLLFLNPSEVSDSVTAAFKSTGLETYLQKKGITITPELVLDADQNAKAQFDLDTSQVLLDYPFWLKIYKPEFDPQHPVTAGLNTLLLPWTHALLFDDQILQPTNRTVLITSSPEAFLQDPKNHSISPQYVDKMQSLPLVDRRALAAEIHLPNALAPLFVMSSSQFLRNNFLNPNYFLEAAPNSAWIANLIEHVTWGQPLIGLRVKHQPVGPLIKMSASTKNTIHFALLSGAILLPLTLWLVVFLSQKYRRKRALQHLLGQLQS